MCKGSYTIEASLLVPLLILVMAGGIGAGVDLYQEIKDGKESEALEEFWAVEKFYLVQGITEVINDGS